MNEKQEEEEEEECNNEDPGLYIVTGASSGIGKATAVALALRGCQVLAIARRAHLLDALVEHHPKHITACCADLSIQIDIETVVKTIAEKTYRQQPVLGLVHAAGTPVALSSYADTNTHKLLNDLAVHVAAPIALNNLLKSQLTDARILYIDSYSAHAPRVGWASYSIIKSAAQMAARAAAAELVNTSIIRVYPGAVNTPLVASVLDSTDSSPTVETFKALQASGEVANPNDVGHFLADILTRATSNDLAQRDTWDYTNPDDHLFN